MKLREPFFRYLRPLTYNFKQQRIEPSQKGGVAFYVVENRLAHPSPFPSSPHVRWAVNDESIYRVSFAVCHFDQAWSAKVAMKIAQKRFDEGYLIEIEQKPSRLSAEDIANKLLEPFDRLSDASHLYNTDPKLLYRLQDRRMLTRRLTGILQINRDVEKARYMTQEAIEALHLKERYAVLSD